MNEFNSDKMQDRFESVNNESLESFLCEVDLAVYEELEKNEWR